MATQMTPGAWAFDLLLALALVFTAWRLIRMPDLFRSIILFFVFGLLMSVAWVRMNAVDVALAEATIGAGVTGALFLAALARLRRRPDRLRPRPAQNSALDGEP